MKKFILGMIAGALIATIPISFALSFAPDKEFTDVHPDHWFHGPVTALANIGIIDGYADGTFRPGNSVNRAEVAKMVNETYKRVYVGDRVGALEWQVKALQAKIGTLDFPGDCYYNDQWYDAGELVGDAYGQCREDGTAELFPWW